MQFRLRGARLRRDRLRGQREMKCDDSECFVHGFFPSCWCALARSCSNRESGLAAGGGVAGLAASALGAGAGAATGGSLTCNSVVPTVQTMGSPFCVMVVWPNNVL